MKNGVSGGFDTAERKWTKGGRCFQGFRSIEGFWSGGIQKLQVIQKLQGIQKSWDSEDCRDSGVRDFGVVGFRSFKRLRSHWILKSWDSGDSEGFWDSGIQGFWDSEGFRDSEDSERFWDSGISKDSGFRRIQGL